jgi:hypothetical protein
VIAFEHLYVLNGEGGKGGEPAAESHEQCIRPTAHMVEGGGRNLIL